MTSIRNEACLEQYSYNLTSTVDNSTSVQDLCKAVPDGLNDAMFCTIGIFNENENRTNEFGTIVTGETCKGDSGGPFKVNNEEGRKTLAGITSG